MALDEFSLIARFFERATHAEDISLGIGDDAAILNIPAAHELLVSTDTLVEGVHFFPDIPPHALGHKALAVNLSDIAAMGAQARWVTLALTLPQYDENWLSEFARGFFDLASQHNVALVGGDTTRGPLSITVTVHGIAPQGSAVRRSGAREGDVIYLSGNLGDSALGLAHLQLQHTLSEAQAQAALNQHYYPQPQLRYAPLLRQFASSAIDVSDGLFGDLKHILTRSGVSAHLQLNGLPLSRHLLESVGLAQARIYALSGGEDYQLCFSVPKAKSAAFEQQCFAQGLSAFAIGHMVKGAGGIEFFEHEQRVELALSSYMHF